ncbi:NAD(P)H-quinone oxidoreductase subunit I, chloroplastic [Emticicia aquatica]|uniref:NAD(P)H-quinone oxidoreductase subunit I, chloroplastic n=2 Tax=Emticicia aquatica TaxID=1681835 RepID=A0ABN8EUP0_9BACT|nr:NAD(P)H-quinone oxidoreductase subunit I, chloroplastic [Emticicia aquatica]
MKGMSLTLKHFWNARRSRKPYAMQDSSYFDLQTGIVTLQYPHQTLPVPDNGRYQLDCEIDDCIVCDKCAKICPVDCIDIEPIKSSEVISYTSDGSPVRLYAAKFDIDMAKCCFCGLCTTVCPTECLTMTNEYDFSVVDITQMNFEFSNLSAEQADKKRKLYEQFVEEKEALKKSNKPTIESQATIAVDAKPKPAFKPAFKPTLKPVQNIEVQTAASLENSENREDKQEIALEIPKPKPVFKPSFKPTAKPVEISENKKNKQEIAEEIPKPKPVFKPSFKPTAKPVEISENQKNKQEIAEEIPKPKPVFKPSFKPTPKTVENSENQENKQEIAEEIPKSKPVFRPTMKITPKNTN